MAGAAVTPRETPPVGPTLVSEAGAVSAVGVAAAVAVAVAASVETPLPPRRAGTGVASKVASSGRAPAEGEVTGAVELLGAEAPVTGAGGLVVAEDLVGAGGLVVAGELVAAGDLVAAEDLAAAEALVGPAAPWHLAPASVQLAAVAEVGVGAGVGLGPEPGGSMVATGQAAYPVAAASVRRGQTEAVGGSGRQVRREVVRADGVCRLGGVGVAGGSLPPSFVHAHCPFVEDGTFCMRSGRNLVRRFLDLLVRKFSTRTRTYCSGLGENARRFFFRYGAVRSVGTGSYASSRYSCNAPGQQNYEQTPRSAAAPPPRPPSFCSRCNTSPFPELESVDTRKYNSRPVSTRPPFLRRDEDLFWLYVPFVHRTVIFLYLVRCFSWSLSCFHWL